ncbi:hypothetical protein [Arthrobacter sp. 35W]|uniref:hypothetical protein n=1 Tax=Arthrobacter sp. 35W TaxID=1132441 RepID=UPI0003FC30DD|nr:hypothetical protein [Arthrobacter sp. 35W]
MSTVPDSCATGGTNQPAGQRPWCLECRSDAALIIESIVSRVPPTPGIVHIEYTCAACDSYYAHPAAVEQIATILNNTTTPSSGVLQFGHHYIHCGEPMQEFNAEPIRIRADFPDSHHGPRLTDVSLPTRVLRCQCGFRMSLPG